MGIFERFLSIWVGIGMVLGIAGGVLFPDVFTFLGGLQYAQINMVIAVLIWLMIYPMMMQIDFGSIKKIHQRPKGLVITIVVNWLIKPFTMALLAVFFIRHLFGAWISPSLGDEYIAGMILLGVAPCTAMVFVWSQLTKGDANYTLVQVAVNDLIMVVAFAPIAAFLLGVTEVTVPWDTLLLSVTLFVIIPLLAGVLTRMVLRKGDPAKQQAKLEQLSKKIKPLSILGLVGTVILLFGFQAEKIISNPLDIVLIAIPLLIQTYLIFAVAYVWMRKWKQPHQVAAPGAMIGASNFFELAVAVAISLFGIHSGAALATVVGVLVEVPVMLSLVAYANKTKNQFALETA
ncbi:ACR3 family arsenite efflux transporter [Photobacterium aphoticum]|uniref:Arsenic transporter n=2 Tax=Photobacterium aphoticum TaxID=754436 RepID=A0A0J1GQS4_9GAMM|nr:ACR3 family arsenite efflux transporter [Photobacterium aphoticum]KLV02011.1 arsenic transporter [Photobacterium aphoticum]PSU60256.1 arsenical-resistance protein [Photobacterium aphoticum]GHA34403.1 arsenical-resistance protein [Photobacterium aphoticum]